MNKCVLFVMNNINGYSECKYSKRIGVRNKFRHCLFFICNSDQPSFCYDDPEGPHVRFHRFLLCEVPRWFPC